MKKTIFSIAIAAIMGLALMSCQKDSDTTQKSEIKNSALAAALKAKGYALEGNMLVMDDKALNTATLDLSGTKLTDVSGLEVFPKLEEVNLADNGLGPAFDFAPLPATVKRVNLAGNEIYDYLNLAVTDYEKGEYKLIRPLDKLILPATARYDVDALPAFLKTAPQCDMQMQNGEGKPEKYTTLREIPDPVMRAFLKETFPNKFEGDKLDILKRFTAEQTTTALNISTYSFYANPRLKGVTQLEGAQYIINDSQYAGNILFYLNPAAGMTLSYLKPGKKIVDMKMLYLTTPVLDMSNAQSIYNFASYGNKALKSLDMRASKLLMQRGATSHQSFTGDAFQLVDCPDLEEVLFPDVSKAKSPVSIYAINLIKLPKLKKVDLSKIQVIQQLQLGGLPECTITYPADILYFTINGNKDDKGEIYFDISKEVYDKPDTKVFIEKYKKDNRFSTSGESSFSDMGVDDIKGYNYLSGTRMGSPLSTREVFPYQKMFLPRPQQRLQ